MKKISSAIVLVSFLILSSVTIAKETGHKIKVKIKGMENKYFQVAYHYGNKQYIHKDSVLANKKGQIILEGDEPLLRGIYSIVIPNVTFFDIIVGYDQEYEITSDTADLIANMEIEGSLDNQLHYEFLKRRQQEMEDSKPLRNKLKELQAIEEPKKKDKQEIEDLRSKLKQIGEESKSYQLKIAEDHKDLFYARILNAMREPEVPDFDEVKNKTTRDSLRYTHYKKHFWDYIDLSEDGLARTPIIQNKMNQYMNNLTPKIPDSIITSCDVIIDQTVNSPELYKYTLVTLLNKYANSKIMGMDAVYVHLVEKYYGEKTPWVDSTNLFRIKDRAKTLKPTLIGKIAPQMVMKDLKGDYRSMHDVDAEYTILFFWDPDCGHCKKAVPKLKNLYDELKDEQVEVYAVCVEMEEDKWRNFCSDKELEWINVADFERRDNFRYYYDISSTPKILLVDKNKQILAKGLSVEQLDDFLKRLLRGEENAPIVVEEPKGH